MEQKNWLESLTVQGQIISALPVVYMICKQFGLDFPEGTFESILSGISAVAVVVGMVMTFIGRWKAKTPLTLGQTT